jgi:hypothetical protein
MRHLVFSFVVTLVALFSQSTAFAQSCPANATQASLAIWRDGQLPSGQTFTRMHPCGRAMTCAGGTPGGAAAGGKNRKCAWAS